MAKPRLIILIRHAQSEGNSTLPPPPAACSPVSPPPSMGNRRLTHPSLLRAEQREIHQSIPDHRVKLTQDGWGQAREAGRRLRKLLRPDDTLHFFTSPYRRTRETTEGILATLTSDEPKPSPFRRSNIKVYEEPRLREQDFGNFQPCSAEMERMWQERADYGHFFYRIPNGESAADAYDRVSGFNESLWRQFGEDDFASVCVLVTHGLMSRVFLMKWYHFTVEYFEDLRNVDHCEFLIMRKQENGKYLLENNLRTWSELHHDRFAVKDGKEEAKLDRARTTTAMPARRWGGCPNGCNHTSHYNKRPDLEPLREQDTERSDEPTVATSSSISVAAGGQPQSRSQSQTQNQQWHPGMSAEDRDGDGPPVLADAMDVAVPHSHKVLPSSPDGTPAFNTAAAEKRIGTLQSQHLHVGRDFGGTYSGHTSLAGSDTDMSEDGNRRHPPSHYVDKHTDDVVANRFANRLGDAPPPAAAEHTEMDDLNEAERQDRSIRGSVY
ncbi:hypothetical protein RJ55_00641 [Drechmeria coniospora]|nr:hypothetical protein RJ55_00641 [Drechmeria coniospora]